MSRKDIDPLKVATQMREAIGYLAALASKSELDRIARKLLGVHFELGVKIDDLIQKQNERGERMSPAPPKNKAIRH